MPDIDREMWLDRFARRLGFGRVATLLPWDLPPSSVYAVVTVGFFTVGLNLYAVANGRETIYPTNPYFALQPIVLIGGVVASRSLFLRYRRVVEEMRIADRASNPDPIVDIVPSWLPPGMFAVAAILQLLRGVVGPGWDYAGDVVANMVVFPFVYAPIIAQFAALYLAIEFIAPVRISRSDVGVHFLDPEGVGGLRPLGELVKTAYYYIVAGLIAYALITYAPFVDSSWQVTTYAGVLFTAVWLLSVATVAFAVFTLHRFMHREKRTEIRRLEDRLADIVENHFDVASYAVPDDRRDEVDDLRDRIRRVSETKEYPATFSIWSQLLLSVAIPKALQLLLAGA
jgi:hypothetical protein